MLEFKIATSVILIAISSLTNFLWRILKIKRQYFLPKSIKLSHKSSKAMIWVNITLIINQYENTPKKILTSLTILPHTLFAKKSSKSLWEDQEALLIRKKFDVHLTLILILLKMLKRPFDFFFDFKKNHLQTYFLLDCLWLIYHFNIYN